MTNTINVMLFGIGPIGERITKVILRKKNLKIVGALDAAKGKIGTDLGEIIGNGSKLGVRVTNNVDHLLSETKSDVVLIATTSYLESIHHHLVKCITAGINVISTCEELVYPWTKHPKLARKIDVLAKKYGVSVLGTGINPGFLMDTLPIVLTGLCESVKGIRITRAVPTGARRDSFQRKVGTGMSVQEFREKMEKGEITGHVGFVESVALTAAALGWKLDKIQELPPEPVLAAKEVKTTYTTVGKGKMLGYNAAIRGIKDQAQVIEYELKMHAGVECGYSEYSIEGVPNIHFKIGEIIGDWETANIAVNMIPKVLNAKDGLLTMLDVPLPSALPE